MQIKCFTNGQLEENCYLVIDEASREALVIDPGSQGDDLIKWIQASSCSLKYILNTHGHADHIGANTALHKTFDAQLAIHADDVPLLTDPSLNLSAFSGAPITSVAADFTLQEQDTIAIGKTTFKVLHTPGHTKGGVCFLGHKVLFSGDTLFAESIGRTDLPGGSAQEIMQSLEEKIMVLNYEIVVYPGHGPQTTIGHELTYNPYLN